MAPGLEKFQIIFDHSGNTFAPGQTIVGRIMVCLSRNKSIRGLKVTSRGKAEVGWSQPTGTQGRMTSYTNSEEYFRIEFYLLGKPGNNENIVMQSGEHVLPFNVCLPQNIPSSFEHKNGNIVYAINAVLERPWKFDHRAEILFNVETPFDIGQCSSAAKIIDDGDDKTFCCFPFFQMGSMKIHVYAPTSGYTVGETIKTRISIRNGSTRVNMKKLTLSLEQIIQLHGRSKMSQLTNIYRHGHSKTVKNIVQAAERYEPFDKNSEIDMVLKVPPLPSSCFIYCNIIDVEYRLIVKVSLSACQGTIDKSYPIVIGTRSKLESTNLYAESIHES